MKRKVLLYLLFVFSISTYGQNNYFLKFNPLDKDFKYQDNISDSSIIPKQISSYLNFLHSKGFLVASIDSFRVNDREITVYVCFGEKYKYAALRRGNVPSFLLTKAGYKEKLYQDKPFNYIELADLESSILDNAENNGYPFASIFLDSISIRKDNIEGSFNYDSGPLITFDTLEIFGTTRTRRRYLQRFLGISTGGIYDERKIKRVPLELNRLSFLEQERPPVLIFRDNKARLVLYLKDKPTNYIDGLVGILPNEGNNNKVLLTGEVNLLLNNIFGTGKKLQAEWKKYNQASQLLNFLYYHPTILGSSLNLGLNFNLLKQDSSFMNIDRGIKLVQPVFQTGNFSLFTNIKSSRNLGSSNSLIINTPDFNYYQYGLGYNFQTFDNIFFPSKGWGLAVTASLGNKLIRNLNQDTDSDIEPSSTQYSLGLDIQKFTKIRRKSTVLTSLTGGTIINNKNVLFVSDFYRLGGLTTLRGFNEKYFYASSFLISTLEYRFFLDYSSYLLLFIDQGILENRLNTSIPIDNPTGFGAGVSFTTGPGIFTFVYSLGRNKSQNIAFNLSKIHFGFTSKF